MKILGRELILDGRTVEGKRGATREVLLLGQYAIKIPSLRSWRHFIKGMLANTQEREFSATKWPELCPVLGYLPLGLMTIMQRAEPVAPKIGWAYEYHAEMLKQAGERGRYIPTDPNPDNFGRLDGRIVVTDYGS